MRQLGTASLAVDWGCACKLLRTVSFSTGTGETKMALGLKKEAQETLRPSEASVASEDRRSFLTMVVKAIQ